jgi:hypothetical protein
LPKGEKPATARRTRLVTMSQLASRVKRVHRRMRPSTPIEIRRFDGAAKNPSVFDSVKNI